MRVGTYGRYSTERQDERSIKDQRALAEEKAIRTLGVGFHPTLVFADGAQSGDGSDRSGYEALNRAIVNREIDVLVLDDLARLTRDTAETLQFLKLVTFYDVRLISCDGIDTNEQGAKGAITFKAIGNEQFIESVRHSTKRGMRSRAIAGCATGGLAYGYQSRPIFGRDGKPEAFEIAVDETEAKVVRRAFDLYLAGWSPARIAGLFNAEGLPPPRDGMLYKQRGWGDTTIRSWLHNKRYAGTWEWGRREWRKVPGTNIRRSRLRPEPAVVKENPSLRIIDEDVWTAVQARLAAVRERYTKNRDGTPKGRSVPGNATPHPLSGILSCGACGAPMVVNGGSDRRRYACAHARQRQTCTNKVTVRVSDAQTAILGALRRRFTNPVAIAYVRKRVVGRLTEMLSAVDAEIAERRARLQRVELRARRILDLIADGESGPTAMSAIRDFEAQANDERAHIAALEAQKRLPVRIPSNDEIREQYFALEKVITADPLRGREALRQLFRGGLKLVPDEDGTYIARGDLSWLGFVLSPRNAKPSADDSGRVSVPPIDGLSCGGRI